MIWNDIITHKESSSYLNQYQYANIQTIQLILMELYLNTKYSYSPKCVLKMFFLFASSHAMQSMYFIKGINYILIYSFCVRANDFVRGLMILFIRMEWVTWVIRNNNIVCELMISWFLVGPRSGPVFCLLLRVSSDCDWPSTAWAYSEEETENGPRFHWCFSLNQIWRGKLDE